MAELTPQTILDVLQRDAPLSSILHLEDFAEPDKLADRLAREYTGSLKPTQLRRFFHAIKDVERDIRGLRDEEALPPNIRRQLLPLMPELAYARGRALIPENFYRLLKACLDSRRLRTVGDLRLLAQFLTAILAYHKLYESDKKKGD